MITCDVCGDKIVDIYSNSGSNLESLFSTDVRVTVLVQENTFPDGLYDVCPDCLAKIEKLVRSAVVNAEESIKNQLEERMATGGDSG